LTIQHRDLFWTLRKPARWVIVIRDSGLLKVNIRRVQTINEYQSLGSTGCCAVYWYLVLERLYMT